MAERKTTYVEIKLKTLYAYWKNIWKIKKPVKTTN